MFVCLYVCLLTLATPQCQPRLGGRLNGVGLRHVWRSCTSRTFCTDCTVWQPASVALYFLLTYLIPHSSVAILNTQSVRIVYTHTHKHTETHTFSLTINSTICIIVISQTGLKALLILKWSPHFNILFT